jgi:sporulation protein YlmC with PRC-barrel domain
VEQLQGTDCIAGPCLVAPRKEIDMIQSLKHLSGFAIEAPDGTIGKVKNAYFDDSEWAVRYLIVDTGNWLTGRDVLISPLFVNGVDTDAATVQVTLSREQVKDSPGIDFDKPVSRQQEAEYFRHYRSFGYWGGPFVWGPLPYPTADMSGDGLSDDLYRRLHRGNRHDGDSHLRSADEVRGYHIQAHDGGIGHVEDFLIDDETWLIESLIVDTRNWLPGKHVVIPASWVEAVDWSRGAALVGVDREAIRERPEYPHALTAPAAESRMQGNWRDAGQGRRGSP